MQYCLKLSATSQNPAYSVVFAGKFKSFFDNKPNQIPTLGIRVQPDLQAIGFKQMNTLQCSIPATSPWLFSHPCVNFDLHRFYKDDTTLDIFRSMFYEICASYDNFDHIYTDGSKMGDRVASAAICSNMVRSTRLPNNASIFRAQLYAITLAMYFVRRGRNSNFVIFSDSMSSPEALNGFKFELDLVQKIIKDYTPVSYTHLTLPTNREV